MQQKYITQIEEMYDDFTLVYTPLLEEEVRGVPRLLHFGELLLTGR
jgi:anion-transporting  ArsA/GET3 family ATPase